MNDSWLRRLLNVSGTVATVFGVLGIARGVLDVRGHPIEMATHDVARDELTVPRTWVASLDSEFRFYAAWYAGSGAAALYLAQKREMAHPAVGAIGATWVTAAVGRLLSARAWGRPHSVYVALTGVELIVGGVLLRRAFKESLNARGSASATSDPSHHPEPRL